MKLHDQVAQSLAQLQQTSWVAPHVAVWTTEGQATIEVAFTTVDRMSCAFRELRVTWPAGAVPHAFDTLKAWADEICRKATYLLEPLAVLEADATAQALLVRSNPPGREPTQVAYYEVPIQSPGTLCLRRYVCEAGDGDRVQVDIQATHEVLQKLVRDLVAVPPQAAAV